MLPPNFDIQSAGKKPNPFNKGQVNHVNVEEVEEQPDAVIGKFLVLHGYEQVLPSSGLGEASAELLSYT